MKKIFILMLSILFIAPEAFGGSFTDNGDGTVTDNETGLMWQKCSMGQTHTDCKKSTKKASKKKSKKPPSYVPSLMAKRGSWAVALSYCETEIGKSGTFAGYSDWRLPTVSELESLTEDSRHLPAIDKTIFPNTVPTIHWSSTSYADNPKIAWMVDFYWGRVYSDFKSFLCYVRCVRSGK